MTEGTNHGHALPRRRFPYPYQAMLAICSDLDETPDRQVYFETMRFLNSTEPTAIGQGVGLEVGNTIYFDMPPDQFAYWNTDDTGRAMIRECIRSGHIDCLHSYGDLATTRDHAQRALEELAKHDCRLEVWVDHGAAATNLDADIMKGSGDLPGSPAYHADLSYDSGIRYVWKGRVTSVIGQDRPRSLAGIGTLAHPILSGTTLLKEFTKGLFARFGQAKYRMHAANRTLRETVLRDGRPVWEFMRCNPHWGGVSSCETATGISKVLTEPMLRRLVKRQGSCILYTHLGKIAGNPMILSEQAKQAFALLARFAQEKKILVTTTRRLLGYCRAMLQASPTSSAGGGDWIDIDWAPKSDLAGLTLYHDYPEQVRLRVNGRELSATVCNPPDDTGKRSLSIPWRPLAFPLGPEMGRLLTNPRCVAPWGST